MKKLFGLLLAFALLLAPLAGLALASDATDGGATVATDGTTVTTDDTTVTTGDTTGDTTADEGHAPAE